MRISRSQHRYSLPLDLSQLSRPVEQNGLGLCAPGQETSYAAAPLAALPALLHRNPYQGRALRPDELPKRLLATSATAYVNDGRWVARCPTEGCNAALDVSPDDPRFLCPICWQGWYPVRFPADVDAIETVLALRPGPLVRNWLPGETVADLRRENRDHGLPDA